MDEYELTLRADLRPEHAKMFLELKEQLGLTNNTEVVRTIILYAHDRMVPKPVEVEQSVAPEVS